jgi:hypothetical protein
MFSRLGLLASVVVLPLAFSAQKADAAVYTFSSSVTTIETQSASAPPGGLMTMQDGVTTLTFDDVVAGKQPIGFTPPSGTIPGGGVVAGGGNRGLYAPPNGDVSQFYAVALNPVSGPTVPASDTFTTEGYNNYFGFYWGSIDYSNQIAFYCDAELVVSFTGADFAPADGNQIAPNTNEFIDFFFTDGVIYNKVVFFTTQLNFEIDNVSYGSIAVPGPTSLALFSTSLAALSFFRRRRTHGQRHSDLSAVSPSRTFDRDDHIRSGRFHDVEDDDAAAEKPMTAGVGWNLPAAA